MPLSKKFTYADYLEFPDDERWEIIDGIPYMLKYRFFLI